MIFTKSQDGIPRANVNVRFRVGIDLLEHAGQEIVWRKLVNEGRTGGDLHLVAERHAQDLSRAVVEREVRKILRARGYAGYERDDDYYALAERPVKERIQELYGKERNA